MLSSLRKLFSTGTFQNEAHAAYVALVGQSRKTWFYEKQGVPDTIDGRFDVMALHLFLVIHRLRREDSSEAAEFVRAISEAFFSDMDRSLREMGSTDTGVGIRVKKMAQAFYGRLNAYEHSLLKPEGLTESLKRNLYRESAQATAERLEAVAGYMRRNADHLSGQDTVAILNGSVTFLD